MKKTKKLLITVLSLSLMIASFSIVFCHDLLGKKTDNSEQQHYTTPEDAIENELATTNYKMIESNGTYFAVCDTYVNDYACQYICNDGNGWQVVTDYMFRNAFFVAEDKNNLYGVYIREYMGKYMIYVSQSKDSIESNGRITVTDSVGSNFVEMDFNLLNQEHYWYWCLDELPMDYTISVNGKVIFG